MKGPGQRLMAACLLVLTVLQLASAAGPAANSAPGGAAPSATPAPVAVGRRNTVIEAVEVLRVADAVARALATTRRIPAADVVTLSDGNTLALSAARVFVLLTRFLGNGYEQGVTPEYAPVPPEMAGPLTSPEATTGAAGESVISTADLLAQARPTADVAESTANLPSAVWVEGLRLTPAQYMGALATVLQHAASAGEVPQRVSVGNYLPPLDWTSTPTPGRAPVAPQPRVAPPVGAPVSAPPTEPAPAAAEPTEPKITVHVPVKPPLSGEVALTVEYEGPPAFIRVSIDGNARAVSNMVHFTYLWDTRLEPDGSHTLRVAAVDQVERTVDSLEADLETANGNVPLR